MGKLGQMGGLMWRVTENWVMEDERRRCSEAVSWLMIKRERETCQLGQLFDGAESSSWVRHFDWLTPVMSARVKVTVNLSLSYGFNQNFDEGLGTVHNPCPSLSCLKSVFLDPDCRDVYCADFFITFKSWATVGLKPGQSIMWELTRMGNII